MGRGVPVCFIGGERRVQSIKRREMVRRLTLGKRRIFCDGMRWDPCASWERGAGRRGKVPPAAEFVCRFAVRLRRSVRR